MSRRLEHHIHPDGIEREDYQPFIRPVQHARVQQGVNIAVHRLHVAVHAAGGLGERWVPAPAVGAWGLPAGAGG